MADFQKNIEHTIVTFASAGQTARVFTSGDVICENYRLKGLIGRGGMGYVFAAEHLMLQRDFALKVLDPAQVNEMTWNRFQIEGKAIARLDHPNIVKIYNMGVDRGDCPYYVMDLLYGVTLLDCIKDGLPLSLDEVVDMYIQLAEGFGYAHNRGIVHRDVKPGNIVLIDSGGQYPTAKIVDFGIAKLTGVADQREQSLTAAGEICGSPFYMSPEQGMGGEIDSRSDIYSLGCTLFETLCRRPPFMGKTALETVMMHQNEPVPALADITHEAWPDELESIVAKMLAKRTSDRYQSMSQLKHDLERVKANKAVGKNVETGFRSSAETRLEDLGSRYETEKFQWVKDKRILGKAALTVAVLAVIASFYISRQLSAPLFRRHVGYESNLANLTIVEKSGANKTVAPVISRKFDSVKAITSTINHDGSRTFFCPSEPIGDFTWYQGRRDVAGEDADCRDDGHALAMNNARVQAPASTPIIFSLDLPRFRDTWVEPQVLSKFGAKELNGLKIEAKVTTAAGSSEELDQVGKAVESVLKAVAGWSELKIIELTNVPVSSPTLALIDRHKKMRHLAIRDSFVDCDALGKLSVIPRLNYLRLTDVADCDPVLRALKGSSSIALLDLRDSHVSASALDCLSSCPNLKILIIEGCPVSADEFEAISKIKSLKRLSITRVSFRPQQIEALSKLAFVDGIALDLSHWTVEDRQALRKRLPNLGKKPVPKD